MNFIRLAPALSACLAAAAAAETLELEIRTGENNYRARQELGETFESFNSGAIPGDRPPREYLAIRCGGPWGALKYRVTLPSGPGYQLRANNERLLLQILEHSVISEDRAIAAMSVHCVDTEPRQVVKSLVEIELERGSPAAQQVQLANGYVLEYRYTP
ncbi:hypothetical protein [Microbulbifer rhizosphaerae]|uniref:Uncharacterized protein n=1 Tax=Microbulbifer rhizosphaerae TaxID=1562603 RepID=A0A7W4WDK4_9GAMM|nr:hypothetical protein [Microbulbifer rhizosphaerae]MBB3062280.1 hypothetical protein [Microbulbifer rhizosphaerae]